MMLLCAAFLVHRRIHTCPLLLNDTALRRNSVDLWCSSPCCCSAGWWPPLLRLLHPSSHVVELDAAGFLHGRRIQLIGEHKVCNQHAASIHQVLGLAISTAGINVGCDKPQQYGAATCCIQQHKACASMCTFVDSICSVSSLPLLVFLGCHYSSNDRHLPR